MDKEDLDAQIDVIKNRNYVVTLNNMQLNAQLTKLPTNEKTHKLMTINTPYALI